MSAQPLHILGISGSYGISSKNGLLLEQALATAAKSGAVIHHWDHVANPLPLVGAEGCWEDENVRKFQELATSCQGFILSSPEYHGTMSGVMKNSLDWLYDKHVGGKAFAVMSTLGGISNSNTLNHMRISLRWLHGWVIPEQVAVGKVKDAFSEDGVLKDPDLCERVENMVASLLKMSATLAEE